MSVGTRAVHEDLPRTSDLRSPHTWALRALAGTCRGIVGRWYDVEVTGAEHWPTRGPVVVAANHTGFIDGPLTPQP